MLARRLGTALTILMIAGAATADAKARREYREPIQTSSEPHAVADTYRAATTSYDDAPRVHRRSYRGARQTRPAVPRSGMVAAMCGAKPIMRGVASTMAGRFASFCRELASTGYRIEFVGGWRPGSCSFGSRHPCGGAIDINQTGRNRVTQRFPAGINAMARRHGLLHGAEWRHADGGHFERLDRHSLAKVEGGGLPVPWPLAALSPQRPEPASVPVPRPGPTAAAAADQGDTAFWEAPEPGPERQPEPVGPGDAANIFRRYQASREVIVASHTSLICDRGRTFPTPLVRMMADAAEHFHSRAYVNSGFRDPVRNRKVGGAKRSRHMACLAADWRVLGVSVGELRLWVMARLDVYGVGGLGTYGTHLHTDKRPGFVAWFGKAKTKMAGKWKSKKRYAKRHHHHRRYAAT